LYALLRFLDQLIDILASGDVLFSIWKNVGTLSIKQGRVSPYSCAGRNFIWTPVCNRVGEVFPLLAARPVRRFSGKLPLHAPVHKKAQPYSCAHITSGNIYRTTILSKCKAKC